MLLFSSGLKSCVDVIYYLQKGRPCLFGVFADVSLHQWARLKTMKSSFQSNPGPTVLDMGSEPPGSRIFHMDNVLPCKAGIHRKWVIIYLRKK